MARPGMPFRKAADARRTTPGPQSTRYGVLLTTIATDGPERSGSALGFPVPSITTCVRKDVEAGVDDCANIFAQPSAKAPQNRIAQIFTHSYPAAWWRGV